MKIKKYKVSELSHDPANARKHNERNIQSIIASLRRFGQQKPIVVDSSGVVRAGNGTLEAARLLGWDEIDGVETELQGTEATAYAVADNRTAELAEWDDDVLAATLQGLVTDDEQLLADVGFDEEELDRLLNAFNAEEIDAPSLADGDRDPFQQMAFTLHDEQAETVRMALSKAKDAGQFDGPNENSNGNALARIAEAYLDG